MDYDIAMNLAEDISQAVYRKQRVVIHLPGGAGVEVNGPGRINAHHGCLYIMDGQATIVVPATLAWLTIWN